MSLLTTGQITAMRHIANLALPDTCTVSRKTTVSDGGGGQTATWADLATGVACRIAPVGGGETGEQGNRIEQATTHVITLPASQDITEADRVTITGVVYDVTLVRERGAWEISRRVEVREAA